ncbi:hypothetical protein [Psychrobacter sp. KCTC 72983]|uniref:hypothetical protein n=1 Tax=Psychrobacter sp. KCTC 72983 TaxID=2733866 RepID=UPI00164845E9|nr:hypothetical protein [Psychrobacter sp. KCTC 72983]
MSQLNSTLATLSNLQAHVAMMAQLTSSTSSETVTINRQDLRFAFADIEQTISGIYAQLSNEGELTFSSSLGDTLDHPMVEQFWDVYDYLDNLDSLNRGGRVNHHSDDADTIAINLNDIYSVAKKNNQPLPDDMVELKQHLHDSCRYLFIDSNVAVSSKVYNGKTIKCWIFQKPVAEAQPVSDTPNIDLAQACSEFEQQFSESAPTAAAPVMEMTEPCIIRRSVTNRNNKTTRRQFYVPSITEEQRNKGILIGLCKRYGVELPAYYHDIDVSRFAEKTYYDENGDKQRVLVPLFKDRREGEHTQAFYQRVGLLLPPID